MKSRDRQQCWHWTEVGLHTLYLEHSHKPVVEVCSVNPQCDHSHRSRGTLPCIFTSCVLVLRVSIGSKVDANCALHTSRSGDECHNLCTRQDISSSDMSASYDHLRSMYLSSFCLISRPTDQYFSVLVASICNLGQDIFQKSTGSPLFSVIIYFLVVYAHCLLPCARHHTLLVHWLVEVVPDLQETAFLASKWFQFTVFPFL